MKTKYIKSLGITVSRLGMGAMRLPLLEDNKTIDEDKAEQIIDYLYKSGVNYFDTAYPYHFGNSETFLKKALGKYARESYFLADKLPVWECDTAQDAKRIFNIQLERCGVEYFDFYLMHALSKTRWAKLKNSGIMECMTQLKKEGKIRFLGFSFHDLAEEFAPIADDFAWEFAQIQTNYVDEVYIHSDIMYNKLVEKNIPCIVMEPVRGGALAELSDDAQEILDKSGTHRTAAEWALNWCLSHENMCVTLSGMSTMEQARENVQLFTNALPLDKNEMDILHKCRDKILSVKTIPCTGCDYCNTCPQNIAISTIFHYYNKYKMFGNKVLTKMDYARFIPEENRPPHCTKCGICTEHCPQGIKIPQEIEFVHNTIKNFDVPLQSDIPNIV